MTTYCDCVSVALFAGSLALADVLPLEMMACGEVGRVVQVVGAPAMVHRLAEMGLRERARIRMVQPGRPCIVVVEDHRLSFRADDGTQVLVALNGGA